MEYLLRRTRYDYLTELVGFEVWQIGSAVELLTKTAVLVAREFDRKGDWRMKWATYIPGHPDANDGWIIPGASWIPSHWMPLPEPPQEAK